MKNNRIHLGRKIAHILHLKPFLSKMGILDYSNKIIHRAELQQVNDFFDNNRTIIRMIEGIFEETYSARLYTGIIDARRNFKVDYSKFVDKKNPQYFIPQVVKYIKKEKTTFIDCGAFIGDIMHSFIHYTDAQFEHIYAFEPETENYEALKIAYGRDSRIELIKSGVWSTECELTFYEGMGGASQVAGTNSPISANNNDKIIKISAKCIDDLKINGHAFIKMDIEGSEMEALKGATNTILNTAPILAISIYHSIEDLVLLPKYIISLCGDEYKYYLRHYGKEGWDTVFYAIPRKW